MGSRVALRMALVAGFAVALDSAIAMPTDSCMQAPGSKTYRALSARDGTSIVTSEGEVIVLAGIVSAGNLDGDPQAAIRAAEALDRLVKGKTISMSGDARDRYGSLKGHVVVVQETGSIWVQGAMVGLGEARVAPQMDTACAPALLRIESEARAGGQGSWSDPRFAIHGPDDLLQLTAAEGRFMVVEGVVRRVGESGEHIYLDFGRRFNEDFSVIVPRDAHKAFTTAGIDLRSLEGARVRVRGILTLRGGPAIELRHPAAMEWLKAGGA
jgi:micrococcal nuclease